MKTCALPIAALVALLASTVHGFGMKPSPEATKVENFKWRYPFEPESLEPFNEACEAEQKFPARQYTLHDLMEAPPKGLAPWAGGLKKFFQGREYPGGWAGWDRHLHDRSLLKMEYADMPLKVREWIEEQEKSESEGKGLFAVFKKPVEEDDTIEETTTPAPGGDRSGDKDLVAIFAPGALYGILPLWVAEGSNCADDLSDLTKYKSEHVDGGVVAWPSHTSPEAAKDLRGVSIHIKALLLSQKEGWASTASESKAEETKEAAKEQATEQAKGDEKKGGKDEL